MCLLLLRTGYSSIIGSTKINDIKVNRKQVNTCLGQYIYIHDLPKQFNEDVLENCHLITRKIDKFDMCMTLWTQVLVHELKIPMGFYQTVQVGLTRSNFFYKSFSITEWKTMNA